MASWLEIIDVTGHSPGARFDLCDDFAVGREPRHPLSIPARDGRMLSRTHARFRVDADGCFVGVSDSSNGVTGGVSVNGVLLPDQRPHALADGDVVTLGTDDRVRFRSDDALDPFADAFVAGSHVVFAERGPLWSAVALADPPAVASAWRGTPSLIVDVVGAPTRLGGVGDVVITTASAGVPLSRVTAALRERDDDLPIALAAKVLAVILETARRGVAADVRAAWLTFDGRVLVVGAPLPLERDDDRVEWRRALVRELLDGVRVDEPAVRDRVVRLQDAALVGAGVDVLAMAAQACRSVAGEASSEFIASLVRDVLPAEVQRHELLVEEALVLGGPAILLRGKKR